MPDAITTTNSSDHPLRIFAAIELSRTKWIVAIQVSGSDKVSLIELPSGDTARLLGVLEKAGQKAAGGETRPVEILTCYEAGYDGFWLHRFLEARGIRNWIVDFGQHPGQPSQAECQNRSDRRWRPLTGADGAAPGRTSRLQRRRRPDT